jgi:hypothetical protein
MKASGAYLANYYSTTAGSLIQIRLPFSGKQKRFPFADARRQLRAFPPNKPQPNEKTKMKTTENSPFGEVIFAYTRKQAIADGNQVDVSTTAKEAGIKFPMFLTRAVFDAYVAVPPNVTCQDEAGRLWDIPQRSGVLRWFIRIGPQPKNELAIILTPQLACYCRKILAGFITSSML